MSGGYITATNCAYHKPDHLWRVLFSPKNVAHDSALNLHAHCADGLDAVCYAFPHERRPPPQAAQTCNVVSNKFHARAPVTSS